MLDWRQQNEQRAREQQDAARERIDRGPGGDHDVPYHFSLLWDKRIVDTWLRLLARVQRGDFEQDG